jgi:HEPN domain.
MIKYRLDFAKNYLEDALELFNKGSFNSSASRAYYASYQAMWAALGDHEDGKIWRHLAIIKHFVRGYWFAPNHPKTGPGLLEDKRLPLRRLYSYRIKSDYDAMPIDGKNLEQLLKVVEHIIKEIDEKGGK